MEPNSDDANLDYRDVLRLKATRHSTFFRHLSSMNWHSSSSESHQSSSSTAMTSADVVIPMNSHTIPSAGESHTVLRQTLSQKWRQKFTNGLSYAPDTADRPEPTLSIGNPNRSDVLPCTDSAEDHHISSENVNELMELNKQRDGSTNKIAAQTFNHQPLRHPHRAATIVPADFDSDSCECGDCGRFCCYGNSVSKYNKYQATDKSEAERETRKAISRDVTVNGNSSVLCCNCSHGRFFHTDNNNYCCTDIQFQQSSTASRTDANHSEQLVESTARLPPECDCCRGPDTCHTTSADVRNNARVASHRCDDALTAVVAAHQQPKQYTVETSSIFLRQRKQVVYSRDALKKAQKIQCDNLCGDARVRVNTAAAAASASAAFSFPCVKKSVKSYLAMIEKKSNELRMQSSGQSTTTSASTKVTVNCDNKNSGDSCSSSAALTNNLRQTNFECISVTPPPPPPPSPSGEHPHPQSPNSPQLDSLERVDFTRSPSSDEGCHPNRSPFFSSSSDEDDGGKSSKEKVARSPSSDSALGLDDEIVHNADDVMMMPPPPPSSKRRMTLTVSDILVRTPLLPLIDPCNLPQFKCTDNVVNTGNLQIPNQLAKPNIPSKTILEARIIEIPPTIVPTTASAAAAAAAAAAADNAADPPNSRRESAQSCISEGGGEIRYMRTPSVVVSDYSDDVMCGITLEEIEYFRKQRMRRGSLQDCDRYESDISAASSCSNLNYCGSTISYLDMTEWYPSGNLAAPSERKVSNCSSCSTLSGDEEDSVVDMVQSVRTKTLPKKPSGWRKLRNIVQWTPFFQTYKRQRYPWVQLAGHQGNFKAGPDQGTVLKKLCPKEELCFKVLMKDVLRPYVPEYKGQVTSEDGEVYLQLQDLLGDFNEPCVMDCKIGVRTYLEEELSKAKEKPKLRKDMYEKMIQIDPEAPNDEEHRAKGVTKPRYMIWRETISSTATLGFRIEGIKKGDGSSKDFKTTKSRDQILAAFKDFTETLSHSVAKYIQRLKAIRATLECSEFFRRHEVIGSSLLFVHDKTQASIWLIDFAKTVVLPEATAITHSSEWSVGNHEDGYLIGINNLISIFEEVQAMRSAARNTYLEENLPKLSLNCEEQILNNNNEMEVMPSVQINCSGPGGTE